ncbi:unnamed protein product [Amaranthus hypochondriacus]
MFPIFLTEKFLCLFLLVHGTITTLSATNDPYYRCYINGSSTTDSTYIYFRNYLLSDLADQVERHGGYYSVTITGSGTLSLDPICFGLCRKDLISSDSCHTCIDNSASFITNKCPVQKKIFSWSADSGCVVQCVPSDSDSDSDLDYDINATVNKCNDTNIPVKYHSQFGDSLRNMIDKLAVEAADAGSSSFPAVDTAHQYFAAEEIYFGNVSTIYGIGYCVPSLSKNECTTCLKNCGNQSRVYCNGKQGGTFFTSNCVLRYELYQFYTITGAPSPLVSLPSDGKKRIRKESNTPVSNIVLPIVGVVALTIITGILIVMKRRKQRWDHKGDTVGVESVDSCLEFSFHTLKLATNDFSESNKLGQGGFGVVYKGRLTNGMIVAVKRLTRYTVHGEAEFKNEVQLVAQLHHRNLVRLIGFCVWQKERILLYELAFNGSLDCILFDPNRRQSLTWKIRYNIIEGIARGMLYLHEESQLRIIHRDLKASNILLDKSMNPKIADFGTARLFLDDSTTASRVVGTYGYMPPEYAKYGKISTKLDIFSFGVLLLEIITGRRNNATTNPNRIEHLLSKVWRCWISRQIVEVIDPILVNECNEKDDIMRCIHIGLLCVQDKAVSRPCMSQVILLLEGCSYSLPSPTAPAYLMEISTDDEHTLLSRIAESNQTSVNQLSFSNTYPDPR